MAVTKEPLTDEARRQLVKAVKAEDWPAVLAGIQQHHFNLPADASALKRIIRVFVVHELLKHRSRWDEKIGQLTWALGLQQDDATDEAIHRQPCTVALAAAGFGFERGLLDVARENAEANLLDASNRGAKLTGPYVAELVSIGHRNALLGAIAAAANAEPSWFFAQLVRAPALPDDDAAGARRRSQIVALAKRAGGPQALAARLERRGTLMWRLHKTYRALCRQGQQVDAVELLLGLLAGESERDFLVTQVRASQGHNCAECGRALGSGSEAHRILRRPGAQAPRAMRLAKPKPANYELVCDACDRRRSEATVSSPSLRSGA